MCPTLVLNADLLSVIIHQLDLEGTRKEFELFFDLLRNAFSVRKVRQRGENLRPEPIVGAFSRRQEGHGVALGIVVTLDEQGLICPL